MSTLHSTFLKEMGITEWVARDDSISSSQTQAPETLDKTLTLPVARAEQNLAAAASSEPRVYWWFFGNQPQGEAQVLFQNIVRVLGLAKHEWAWKNPGDDLAAIHPPKNGIPVVAFAFGGPTAQKITGERDPLPQLRETILALNTGNNEDIPVVASFDLNQMAGKTREKSLLWQDLLLAKSVLQNS
jgi:DNA polymerase